MKTLPVQAHSRMEPISARSRREARKAPSHNGYMSTETRKETDICVSLTAVSKCIYLFRNSNSFQTKRPTVGISALLLLVVFHLSFILFVPVIFSLPFFSVYRFLCYTITGKSWSLLQFNVLHFQPNLRAADYMTTYCYKFHFTGSYWCFMHVW